LAIRQTRSLDGKYAGDHEFRGLLGIEDREPRGFIDIRIRYTVDADMDALGKLCRLTASSPVLGIDTEGQRSTSRWRVPRVALASGIGIGFSATDPCKVSWVAAVRRVVSTQQPISAFQTSYDTKDASHVQVPD